MDAHEMTTLFDEAVPRFRSADGSDAGWELLVRATTAGEPALRLAVARLAVR